MSVDAAFRAAMREAGIETDAPIVAEGKLRRFHVEGDRHGTRNGWYVLHPDDPPAGAFGSWRTGVSRKWCAGRRNGLSPEEQERWRRRVEAKRRERKKAERESHARGREKAARLWAKADPADPEHPYLVAKRVQPHGIHQLRDTLLVSVVGADETLRGLQRIAPDGSKRFLPGTQVAGGYYTIGNPDGRVVVAEGFATAATIHEATGHACAVAFNAGNLRPVAEALRAKLPDGTRLVVAADNDRKTTGNPGLTKATAAARAVDGLLAIPVFGDGANGTDFNDLAALSDLEAVRASVEGATAPPALTERLQALGLDGLGDDPGPDARRKVLERWKASLNGADPLQAVQERNELIKAGLPAGEVDVVFREWRRASGPGGAGGKDLQGQALGISDPEPWPDPVDGAALLDDLAKTFARYLALPEGAAEALALWTVHAHAHGASEVSPVLAITSPTKQCGKTLTLEVLSAVVPRPLGTSSLTPAVTFRAVEKYRPTLLVDEADTFLRDRADELRGVLNSGHRRAMAQVVRSVGDDHEARVFSTWCPKAIACIGRLPSTLADRSVEVRMRRRAPGETVERWRLDRHPKELEPLRRQAWRWARDNLDALRQADPDVPGTMQDRAADNARPLLAIADLAGGEWPEPARTALLTLHGQRDEDDGDAGVILLADLRRLFVLGATDGKMFSRDIVAALVAIEDRPWPEWGSQKKPITATGVSRLLRPFDVRPKKVRIGNESLQGYELDDLGDAFSRWLSPSEPDPGDVPARTPDVPGAFRKCSGSESGENPHGARDVPGVPARTAKSKGEGAIRFYCDRCGTEVGGPRVTCVGCRLKGAS